MRRALAVVLAILLVLAVAGYAAASVVVYDSLTKVSGDCPDGYATNTPERFTVPEEFEMDPEPWFMPAPEDVTAAIGHELLGPSMLIFETAGVTLLCGMIAVIALAARRGRFEDAIPVAESDSGHRH